MPFNSSPPQSAGSSNGAYSTRSGGATTGSTGSASASPQTPDRRFSQPDRSSPAPPIVVVSSDAQNEANSRAGSGNYNGPTSLTGEPPRSSRINQLRQTPKDTIPIIGKPPRKQRSSRFVPSEKVEIEGLPPFLGRDKLLDLGSLLVD